MALAVMAPAAVAMDAKPILSPGWAGESAAANSREAVAVFIIDAKFAAAGDLGCQQARYPSWMSSGCKTNCTTAATTPPERCSATARVESGGITAEPGSSGLHWAARGKEVT